MPPLVLVLDSSSLRQLNPAGSASKRLAELVRANALEIVVHPIVENEVATGIAAEASEARRASGKQQKFARWLPTERSAILEKGLKEVDEILRESATLLAAGVKGFLDGLGAQRIGFEGSDSEHVFRAYFEGNPPFGSPKARGDLPDAFILQPIRRLVEAGRQVHVLLGDKRLTKACETLGATTHSSLRTVFDLPELAPHVSLAIMLDFTREHEGDIKEHLADALGNEMQWQEVQGDFPSDNGDATISQYGFIEEATFHYDHAEALDANKILVPVTCRIADTLVDVCVFKSDFWEMDDRKRKRYSVSDGDWNDHYLQAQSYVVLTVEATIVVSLAKDRGTGRYREIVGVEVLEFDEVAVEGQALPEVPDEAEEDHG